ncbi:MAG: DUF4868 domain-containing protein [Gammaproteobacteria bacterium]|nr:DUF4868 domain-containing protein [Gammaproteobacteria bacterium]
MTTLDDLKAFDVDGAEVTLWVVKKSTPAGKPPRFTSRYVDTKPELDAELKLAMRNEINRIIEVQEYGLLTENNESSALSISTAETHAGLIVEGTAEETPQNKADALKKVQNSAFYVIKLVSGDAVIRGVRKTDASWRVRRVVDAITVFFSDEQLGIDKTPTLYISHQVDFLIAGDLVLALNKANFESIVNYKQAHKDDFASLLQEPEFEGVIADTKALVSYVGENKIQLRRASAIRQKGHYKDPGFMQNLREQYKAFRLNIVFDADGKIVPTPETCRDIVQALLDHRLASGFSENVYDVPDVKLV